VEQHSLTGSERKQVAGGVLRRSHETEDGTVIRPRAVVEAATSIEQPEVQGEAMLARGRNCTSSSSGWCCPGNGDLQAWKQRRRSRHVYDHRLLVVSYDEEGSRWAVEAGLRGLGVRIRGWGGRI
jgi:hypothetical protein